MRTIPGCGLTEGYSVEDYLHNVARIQYSCDTALVNLNDDLNTLGGRDLKAVEITTERLKNEQGEVESAREKLEGLEAPEAAAPLKSHLLDLYSQGAENIGILAAGGDYRLAVEPLISEYESASRSFSEKVKTATDSKSLIACMQEYKKSLAGIAGRLKPVEPSMLSLHSHQRFIDDLNTLQAGLDETVTALESGDRAKLDDAAKKMEEVNQGSELQGTIAAERQADIKVFNAKVQRMTDLMAQIGQDQLELHQRFDRQ